MNSVKDVRQGSFCGTEKSLIGVNNRQEIKFETGCNNIIVATS